jgi:hypothetical protein
MNQSFNKDPDATEKVRIRPDPDPQHCLLPPSATTKKTKKTALVTGTTL